MHVNYSRSHLRVQLSPKWHGSLHTYIHMSIEILPKNAKSPNPTNISLINIISLAKVFHPRHPTCLSHISNPQQSMRLHPSPTRQSHIFSLRHLNQRDHMATAHSATRTPPSLSRLSKSSRTASPSRPTPSRAPS